VYGLEAHLTMSKLGLHLISWNNSGNILDFIAKAKPRVVKMLDFNDVDTSAARASSPSTLFIGRQYVDSQPLDNPAVNARNLFNQLLPAIYKMGSRVDIWEGYNEVVIKSPDDAKRYSDFTVAWADIMHSQGLRCAAFSFSVANPELQYWPLLADGARACDYLALHEYDSPRMDTHVGDFCLRYRRAYAALPADARRPIIITECGIDDGHNQGWLKYATTDDYLAQLAWYDNNLMVDDYVLGCTIFTVDSRDWRYFEVLPILPQIASYIVAHPSPPPPPPPAPGTPSISAATLTPTSLNAGDLLQVSITVVNNSNSTLPTMGPDPGLVYTEGETFRTLGYSEVRNQFRVGVDFNGSTGNGGIDHPYRWGFGASLAPGQSVTVKGAIRLNAPQSRYFWAGLVQEQIVWVQDAVGRALITVNAPPPPPPAAQTMITHVDLTPSTLNGGDLLDVTITVFNGTNETIPTQGPNPGFIYNEGENFRADGFTETKGPIRVGVDFEGRSGVDHPYRWGLGSPLAPGQTAVVSGAIRMKYTQSRNYWIGLVREQIAWLQDHLGTEAITVIGSLPPPATKPVITSVTFSPTTFDQGNLLQVSVTIQNPTSTPLLTQGPDPGFIYNEGDNFLTKHNPPTSGAFRIGLDYEGRTGVDHPYRWGLGSTLAPGGTVIVNGFVRLNRRQRVNYWVALIQEQIALVQDQQGTTLITVLRS
jgi:hypothetical protein